MMIWLIPILLVIWLIFALLSYAAYFADSQGFWSQQRDRDKDYWSDFRVAVILGFASGFIGLIGLIQCYILTNRFKHGFKYGIGDVRDWIKLQVEFAREKKVRQLNYLVFRDSTKNGKIDDFENTARKVVK